jgi:DNA-binding MarR family transcriptional regulator
MVDDANRAQLDLLYLIAGHDDATQAEIREAADGRRGLKTAGQISEHVNGLRDRGLVETATSGRGVDNSLTLTVDGVELLRDDIEWRKQMLDAHSPG